jgi:L-lactate dehydrogenase complex protein LldF
VSTASVTFHRRAEDALANRQLNATLRRVTARILDSRAAGLGRLPEPDVWRDHGRAIRAHTLAHLDRYLDEFVANVELRGGGAGDRRDDADGT